MNRNQRRFGRVPKRKDSEVKVFKTKNEVEIEEVLPPRGKRASSDSAKPMTNRCCAVTPNQKDIAQLTDRSVPTDHYQNLLIEQYGFDPLIPDTIKQLKELKQVLCGTKVENGSQYVDTNSPGNILDYVETFDGSQWQNIDNADEIEKYITRAKDIPEKISSPHDEDPPRIINIHISDVPRVKVIAEKFSRYKTNNVELRKLDEKIVCLEYDVYDQSSIEETAKPVQIMRAFFSIKPKFKNDNGKEAPITTELPSDIRRNFRITDEDLKRLNEKEVEIIDEKIKENVPYLDDLKKILHRKQIITAKKNKTSLDLLSLYEMAKKEYSPFDNEYSSVNFLSKAELEEVKDLILAKCTSSVHGISRRTIKKDKEENKLRNVTFDVISESIVAELLRENGKINVFQ